MMKDSVFCLVNVLFCVTYWNIYINIVQIAKRHTSSVLAFNMQPWPNILPGLVFACWKQAQDLCVSLLFVQYRYIPICNTKQYIYKTKIMQITLYVIILVLITRYMQTSRKFLQLTRHFCTFVEIKTCLLRKSWKISPDRSKFHQICRVCLVTFGLSGICWYWEYMYVIRLFKWSAFNKPG